LSYKGTDTATAYIDAVQIGSTEPTIGGGGSQQQKPYNIEVFTSADKGLFIHYTTQKIRIQFMFV